MWQLQHGTVKGPLLFLEKEKTLMQNPHLLVSDITQEREHPSP
jgi:hypothetical protein